MAGVVRATAYYSQATDGLEVYPDVCPVADSHRKAAEKEFRGEYEQRQRRLAGELAGKGLPVPPLARPAPTYLKCTSIGPDGRRRWCRYYYGLALKSDETQRIDLSMLQTAVIGSTSGQAACTVLCVGAQRNRPPGV